ncbi:MAG: hypothetical protein HGA49_13090 [Eubacteriaceae bacterium]|nr:hypothetical protein [Eubacteriaceae bacterium]
MKNIDKIWEIQCLEEKIAGIEHDRGISKVKVEIEQDIKKYNKINEAMQNILDQYKESGESIERKNSEYQLLEKKILESEELLYEGSLKKAKTISTLQFDIDTMKKKLEEIRKMIQRLMNQRKVDKANLMNMKIKTEEIRQEVHLKKKLLAERIKDSEGVLKVIYDQMEALKSQTCKETLEMYNKRKVNIYPVVVKDRDGVCSGCNMQFSIIFSHVVKSQEEDLSFTCENCGRIIFVPAKKEALEEIGV